MYDSASRLAAPEADRRPSFPEQLEEPVTEPVIAAAEGAVGPLIQAAAKALAPEAEQLLSEVHDFASAEFAKLDDALPQLLVTAEHDALGAIRTAQGHLENVVNHIRGILGIPALGEPADPTSAAPAPQP